MSGIQSKVTRHAKQQHTTHNEEKNLSTKTNLEVTRKLVHKDIKTHCSYSYVKKTREKIEQIKKREGEKHFFKDPSRRD